MKEYKVFRSISFQEDIAKYDKNIQNRVDKIEDKLIYNPEYGTPLGTKWFRESRFENYRIYYVTNVKNRTLWGVAFVSIQKSTQTQGLFDLIYEDLQAIYIVAISGKKDQQKTINTIRLFLEFFREEIEGLIRRYNPQDGK